MEAFETVGYETLIMSVCDEIKVATMAIDETTILEFKTTIALHFDYKFDKIRRAKKSAKKCAALRSGFNVLVSKGMY